MSNGVSMGFAFGLVIVPPPPPPSSFGEGNDVVWSSSIALQCLSAYYCETYT